MKHKHFVRYLLCTLVCTCALCCGIAFGALAEQQGDTTPAYETAQDGAYKVYTFEGLKTVLTDSTEITAATRNVELMGDIAVTESLTLLENTEYTLYTDVAAGAKLTYAVEGNTGAMFVLSPSSSTVLNLGRESDITATEHLVTIDGANRLSANASFVYNSAKSDAGKGVQLVINNAIIENCQGDGNGAVITLTGANNNITVHNVTFRNNSKPSATKNGLIYCGAAVTIYDGLFENNEHKGNSSGVLYLTGSNATATIYGGTFRGNSCEKEGGVIKSANNTILKIYGGRFENNTAGTNGGAICSLSKTLEIDGTPQFKEDGTTRLNQDLVFENNTAGSENGGIYVAPGANATVTFKNVKATGNEPWDIYLNDSSKVVAVTLEGVEANGIAYTFANAGSSLTLNSEMSKLTLLGASGAAGEALSQFTASSYNNLRVALTNAFAARGKVFALDSEGKVQEVDVPAGETKYDIAKTAESSASGYTLSAEQAVAGETVTLTVENADVNEGIVKLDGRTLTGTDGVFRFVMPSKSVELHVTVREKAINYDSNNNKITVNRTGDAIEKNWSGELPDGPYNDGSGYTTYKVRFAADIKNPYMSMKVGGDNRTIAYRVNGGEWKDVTAQTVKDAASIVFFEGLVAEKENLVEIKFGCSAAGGGAHIKELEIGNGGGELHFAENAANLGVNIAKDIFEGYKFGNAANTPYADTEAFYTYKVIFPKHAVLPVMNFTCNGDNGKIQYRVNGGEWQQVAFTPAAQGKADLAGFAANAQNTVEVMFCAADTSKGGGANLQGLSFSFTDKETLIEKIELDRSTAAVETGSTLTLTATVTGGTKCDQTVTWTSSNAEIATVENGVVSGVAAGTVTVTATAADGKTATCEVTVGTAGSEIDKIELDQTEASVKVGKTVTLTAEVTGGVAADRTVTWSTSNAEIATVENGVVTGVAAGTVTITATAKDGKEAACQVTVLALDESIEKVELDQAEAEVIVGKTVTLVATVTGGEDCSKTVIWTSSNEEIATVDENGVVTGVAVGTVTITATAADNTAKAACTITVIADEGKVLTFAANETMKTVNVQEDANTKNWSGISGGFPYNDTTAYTTYKVRFEVGSKTPYTGVTVGGDNRSISYRVNGGEWKDVTAQTVKDQPAIIFFEGLAENAENLIEVKFGAANTSLGGGAHIKGLSFGKGNKELTFTENAVHLSANVKDDIFVGHKYGIAGNNTPYADQDALYVYKVTFPQTAISPVMGLTCSGGNRSVKYRVNGGAWTAVAVEEDKAENIALQGFTENVQNTVEVMFGANNIALGGGANLKGLSFSFTDQETLIDKIELDQTSATVETGKTVTLTATVTGGTKIDNTVVWTSSDTSVATVENGVVMGVAVGTVTITATAKDGKSATCEITVAEAGEAIQKIELDLAEATVKVTKTLTLTATVTGGAQADRTVTWTSSNAEIATVENGVVTGVKTGTVTVTATAADGKTATCALTVIALEDQIEKVELNRNAATVEEGETVGLEAVVTGGVDCDKTVTWTSSDASVATVDADGVVTGVAAGTVTVTATAKDGKTATCEVTVTEKLGAVLEFANGSDMLTVDKIADVRVQKWSNVTAANEPYADTTAYFTYKVRYAAGNVAYMVVNAGGDNRAVSYSVNGGEFVAVTVEKDIPTTVFFEGLSAEDANEIEVKFAAADTTQGGGACLHNLMFGIAGDVIGFADGETELGVDGVKDKIYVGYKYGVTSTQTPYADADAFYIYKVRFPQNAALPVAEFMAHGDNAGISYRVNGGDWVVVEGVVAQQTKTVEIVGFTAGEANVLEMRFGAKNTAAGGGANLYSLSFSFTDAETLIEKIELNQTTATVEEGKTVTLVATLTGGANIERRIVWTSSDTSVATVRNGVVTGLKAGTVTITARAADGKTAACEVTVTERVPDVTIEKVELDKTTATVEAEATVILKATVTGGADCDKTVIWTSSDTSVATVENGVVTGLKAGTVTITVTAKDGKTATCTVTVTKTETASGGCGGALVGGGIAAAIALCALAVALIAKKKA